MNSLAGVRAVSRQLRERPTLEHADPRGVPRRARPGGDRRGPEQPRGCGAPARGSPRGPGAAARSRGHLRGAERRRQPGLVLQSSWRRGARLRRDCRGAAALRGSRGALPGARQRMGHGAVGVRSRPSRLRGRQLRRGPIVLPPGAHVVLRAGSQARHRHGTGGPRATGGVRGRSGARAHHRRRSRGTPPRHGSGRAGRAGSEARGHARSRGRAVRSGAGPADLDPGMADGTGRGHPLRPRRWRGQRPARRSLGGGGRYW